MTVGCRRPPSKVQDSASDVGGFPERAGHSTPPVFACIYPRGRARAGTVRWGEGPELVMHVKVAGIYFRLVEVAVLQYSRSGFAFSGVAASPIVHVEEAYRGRSQAKNVNCNHVGVFREGLVGVVQWCKIGTWSLELGASGAALHVMDQ